MAEEEIDDDAGDSLEVVKNQKLYVIAETNDERQMSPDARLLLDFKKGSKDSLDSNKTLSTHRLETVVDEGDEDDALKFIVLVHEKKNIAKGKETHIPKPTSSLRTELS
ncbi:hypothetical protein Tco_0876660 [Tanacetum coccineum]|uniref:Uncharacterized protein n=1 Tax=Tanacetum coccineum TaxID=301880 RepID=A0ABQ5BY55_9ASTR